MPDFSHVIIAAVVLAIGYYLGSKYPGALAKATGGVVAV